LLNSQFRSPGKTGTPISHPSAFADATRAGEKARLRTIKDLDEAAGRLGQDLYEEEKQIVARIWKFLEVPLLKN
jgi:hypothetical protein